MDEMKIGSKFTTSIISKLASLAIRKKFGYDVKLNLNGRSVSSQKIHFTL